MAGLPKKGETLSAAELQERKAKELAKLQPFKKQLDDYLVNNPNYLKAKQVDSAGKVKTITRDLANEDDLRLVLRKFYNEFFSKKAEKKKAITTTTTMTTEGVNPSTEILVIIGSLKKKFNDSVDLLTDEQIQKLKTNLSTFVETMEQAKAAKVEQKKAEEKKDIEAQIKKLQSKLEKL